MRGSQVWRLFWLWKGPSKYSTCKHTLRYSPILVVYLHEMHAAYLFSCRFDRQTTYFSSSCPLSKPIKPSTSSNKPLPFIKVIEIKSWSDCAEERSTKPFHCRLKPNSSSTTTSVGMNIPDCNYISTNTKAFKTTNTPEGNCVVFGGLRASRLAVCLIIKVWVCQLYCRYIKHTDSADVHLKFLHVILHSVCKCFDHVFSPLSLWHWRCCIKTELLSKVQDGRVFAKAGYDIMKSIYSNVANMAN